MSDNNNAPSNAEAFLSEAVSNIRRNMVAANGAGFNSLQAFANIGYDLLQAKEAIGPAPRGAFGAWCEANFPFSKEWRARLMKLAEQWKAITVAFHWAEQKGLTLGRKEYSVDGALAFLNEYLTKAEISEIEAELGPEYAEKAREAEAKAAEREQAKAEKGEKKKSEAEILREQLAEALERIRELEAELNRAKGGKAKAKPEAEKPGANVDSATKARARKVYGLATKGATEGERSAATHKLTEMATKLGLSLADFLQACGLEPLADFQQAA